MKCEHCPLKDSAKDCLAITRPHPRYCQLVDPGRPDHDPRYIAVLTGEPSQAKPRPSVAVAPTTPKFDGGRHADIKLLVLGCDYHGRATCGQGCNRSWICLMGKGRPVPGTDATDVTYNDCSRCVSER